LPLSGPARVVPDVVLPLAALVLLAPFPKLTAASAIYPLSLHDALPILRVPEPPALSAPFVVIGAFAVVKAIFRLPVVVRGPLMRMAELTSEVQSRVPVVCRLLLAKTMFPVLRIVIALL